METTPTSVYVLSAPGVSAPTTHPAYIKRLVSLSSGSLFHAVGTLRWVVSNHLKFLQPFSFDSNFPSIRTDQPTPLSTQLIPIPFSTAHRMRPVTIVKTGRILRFTPRLPRFPVMSTIPCTSHLTFPPPMSAIWTVAISMKPTVRSFPMQQVCPLDPCLCDRSPLNSAPSLCPPSSQAPIQTTLARFSTPR